MLTCRVETDLDAGCMRVTDLHTRVEVGRCYISWHPDYTIISYIEVAEYARRRGVGAFILDFIQKENKKTLILGTQSMNVQARAFYKAIGFKEVQRVRIDPGSLMLERLCSI